jgi:hypothetical protein
MAIDRVQYRWTWASILVCSARQSSDLKCGKIAFASSSELASASQLVLSRDTYHTTLRSTSMTSTWC